MHAVSLIARTLTPGILGVTILAPEKASEIGDRGYCLLELPVRSGFARGRRAVGVELGEAAGASCAGDAAGAPGSKACTTCTLDSSSPRCRADMLGSALAAAPEGCVALSQLGVPSLALLEGELAS